ncbi:MAG: VWA domain-containing protein [Gammaproteobacteria bacterium]|nr:MAG: VWA domain-containing protein [Chloroflexota bacterium]TDJ22815.1 MAG: VWA domain-containing protein [Gammaproteobacteria bacterium]
MGLFVLVGCSGEPVNRTTGVYMLLDTSGTYADEIGKAQQIISYTLAQLEPGDSFALARIDTGSFSEKDIVAKVSLDTRPSTSNAQKRQFLARVQEFVESVRPSPYTDITGGLLQALEYLDEKDPGTKTILIFSDLKEDLEEGYVRDIDARFDNVRVVALNVTKLRSDNIDPRQYLDRLDAWRQRVEQSGGTWRVINDLDNLEKLLRT